VRKGVTRRGRSETSYLSLNYQIGYYHTMVVLVKIDFQMDEGKGVRGEDG